MLRLGTDDPLIEKLGALAAHAASQGTLEQCTLRAQKGLKFGMEQSADVLKAWLS